MPDNTENIRRIAIFLWDVAQDLHGAVAKTEIQTSIHFLREKRASLIPAAVTGQMAVG